MLATNAYGYNPATREQQVEQTSLLTQIEANTGGGGGGGNASVGSNGAAAPGSSTQLGFNSAGNLVSVSAGNPLPITGSISATNPSVSATGSAVPASATMIGGTDGTNLRALSTNSSGVLALPTGASTAANQTTGNSSLSSIDGKIANNFGSDATGVRTNAQLGNSSGAADFGPGAGSAQTLRVTVIADQSPIPITIPSVLHNYVDSVYFDYSTDGPVDNTTWVEIDASTAGSAEHLHIFDSCGQTLELGVGAAASEARVFLIAPGGPSAVVDLSLNGGDRLSVRSLGATCSSGQLVITLLN